MHCTRLLSDHPAAESVTIINCDCLVQHRCPVFFAQHGTSGQQVSCVCVAFWEKAMSYSQEQVVHLLACYHHDCVHSETTVGFPKIARSILIFFQKVQGMVAIDGCDCLSWCTLLFLILNYITTQTEIISQGTVGKQLRKWPIDLTILYPIAILLLSAIWTTDHSSIWVA